MKRKIITKCSKMTCFQPNLLTRLSIANSLNLARQVFGANMCTKPHFTQGSQSANPRGGLAAPPHYIPHPFSEHFTSKVNRLLCGGHVGYPCAMHPR